MRYVTFLVMLAVVLTSPLREARADHKKHLSRVLKHVHHKNTVES